MIGPDQIAPTFLIGEVGGASRETAPQGDS